MNILMCLCVLIFSLYSQVARPSTFSSNSSSTQLCPHYQSLALLQFKKAFSIDSSASAECDRDYGVASYPRTDSWQKGTDCCTWDGVTCDAMTGHVIGLDLSCSWLMGTIHPNNSLFLFSHLRRLNLAHNNFKDSRISYKFGRFTSLTHLNLSDSVFLGDIPSKISHLSKLISLDLSTNRELTFKGSDLKYLVDNVTELRELILDFVNMSSFEIGSLRNLSSSLTSLSLKDCGLHGKIPNTIFHLPNLQKLDLSRNNELIIYFPKANWTSTLESLALSDMNFSREVLDSISHLKSLNYFSLSNCNFSGSVPSSFWNLTQVVNLDLSSNTFNGEIPSSLSNLRQLKYLFLRNNHFSGQIPSFFFNLTQLESLDLSGIQLTGPIPSQEGCFPNLTFLSLSHNLLNGTVPSWLYTLPSLVSLSLYDNQLTGHIQEFEFHSLEYLDLGYNKLQGTIPRSIFELTNLTNLYLDSNNFNIHLVLDMFSKLQNLGIFYLSNNNLSWITNNSVTFTLPKLRELYLSSCHIHEIPNFLNTLTGLQWLDLSNNSIDGLIPKWLWNIGNGTFYHLDLSHNKLQGFHQSPGIPSWGTSFSATQMGLGFLDLSNNNIEGLIPKWLWNIGNGTFYSLDLSHNKLQGFDQDPGILPWNTSFSYLNLESNMLHGSLPVPPPSIFFYSVANNKLHGAVPPLICNLTSLYLLDLSNNSFSGLLPPCLGNFSKSLTILNLRNNSFQGTIPHMCASGSSLRTFDVSRNLLRGLVPRSLKHCRELEVLNLRNNMINDTFPFWLETLPELKVLVLRSNRFHGPIRKQTKGSAFVSLHIIDVSCNEFRGSLSSKYFESLKSMTVDDGSKSQPEYMSDNKYYYYDSVTVMNKGLELEFERILVTLKVVDFSNNKFQGEIPKSIGKLKSLIVLNFSHNGFSNHIPLSLGKLAHLESLDLSNNKLFGWIPDQLTSLTFLSVFNVSENNLTGPIPRGRQFETFSNTSYGGNTGLCGFPLSKKCGGEEVTQLPLPTSPNDDNSKSNKFGFGWKVVLMGYGCGFAVGAVIGICIAQRKEEWLLKTFRVGRYRQRRRRSSNNTRRMHGGR